MTRSRFLFIIPLLLFCSPPSFVSNVQAAKKKPATDLSFFEDNYPIYDGRRGPYTPRLSKKLERISALEKMQKFIDKAEEMRGELEKEWKDQGFELEELDVQESAKEPGQKETRSKKLLRQKIKAYKNALDYFYKEIDTFGTSQGMEARLGKVVAKGLAGKNWKAIDDEQIESFWEGAKLGMAMRFFTAFGDVLGKRMVSSTDKLIGGSWDFLESKVVEWGKNFYELMFHDGAKPFTPKELTAWLVFIKICFDDVTRLLKNGLKDSLRGHDMTLRPTQQEESEDEENNERQFNAWAILMAGYVRQFDNFVTIIDQHLEYYDSEDLIVTFATEIKQRILEFQAILKKSDSVKDLENIVGSNRAIIPAFKENITNIIEHLIKLVQPVAYGSSNNISSDSAGSSKKHKHSSYDDNDDDDYTESFQRWYN